jgi:hypothetical protein
MNNMQVRFRAGKTTPKKMGQFVVLWKRALNGLITPFDVLDPIDLFIISARYDKYFGQFVFPKKILHEKGFIAEKNKGGKRAMRIYPPWDNTKNNQANKTQLWQLQYFFEIQPCPDMVKFKKLL